MSCFFLCKKSDAYSSYQTAGSDSGTEMSNSTTGTTDTALTAFSNMGELSNQERADFASFVRVASCMINEKLVESSFTDEAITIWHPNSTDRIFVQLAEKPVVPGFVHPTELSTEITYNGISIPLKGSCMMNIFGRWAGIDVSKLLLELDNSAINLEATYSNSPVVNLDSPPIDWEQSLIEGHPLHPWHKCRYPEVGDFKTAKLYFVAIPRAKMDVVGDYSKWMKRLITAEVDDNRIVLPVHELQLPNVLDAFPEVQVLPQTVTGHPQSSLRTISVTSPDFCIKIPLRIKVTSIVRTIRPWAVTIGHRLEPVLQLIERGVQDFGSSLIIAREFAAAASRSEHLGCIVRESTESIAARTGDRIIVCAAMVEHIDVIWGEDSDKTLVLREFCKHLFRVTLPSVLLHGFALQAHMQNLLIRIDPVTRAIKGFVARDLGSFRVHRLAFYESTALDIDTSWMLTSMDSLEKVYAYILGVVHADVDSMVRALKLGMEGWRIARRELENFVLLGDELARRVWLDSPMCLTHAHVSMQIYGVENECRVVSVPNRFYYCQQT
ncbi:IucC family-domain-containing protein [Cadophora sp. MPI-SDFR-AT-0126]|nr:IucC family-domain-containing protein [Leotiomycetes sp. MPI-SDFR-AT-0126]